MSDSDGERTVVEVTITERHALRLDRLFPAALTTAEALRQASDEAAQAREAELSCGDDPDGPRSDPSV